MHVAIDDYSRVAYVEAHDNETAATLVTFWRRVQDWFWVNNMPVRRGPHRQRSEAHSSTEPSFAGNTGR